MADLNRGLGPQSGIFPDATALQAAKIKDDRFVATIDGQWYSTNAVDGGSGLLLASGNYANPIENPQITTNTANIATNTSDIDLLKADNPNNQVTTAYTLALTDSNKTVWMNNASANVLTIPDNATVAFPTNTLILIMMEGAGVTSITADAGVTLNSVVAGSGDLTQYNGVTLVKRGLDTWIATPLTVA